MASEIIFSNIKHTIIKTASEITDTERRTGKLNARSIINRLGPGLQIDVVVLKNIPAFLCDEVISFNEADIRQGTRRCFQKLTGSYDKYSNRLPVKTDFFKKIMDGDTIIIILHKL